MSAAAPRQSQESQWGRAPLALVPAALRAVAGDREVPEFLSERVGEPLTLRSLDARFWDRDIELSKKDLDAMIRWLGGILNDHRDAAVSESGIPPLPLLALCLSHATRKSIEKALGSEPIKCDELTIGTILDIPKVGTKRALEFLSALDVVVDDAYRKSPRKTGEKPEKERRRFQRTPREIKAFFRVLSAWAVGEKGEENLRHSLPEPHPEWPPELVQLWKRIRYCSATELAGNLAHRYGVPKLLAKAFEDSEPRHRLILQARVFSTDSPTSLDSLSRVLERSPERIKALQRKALTFLERLQTKPYEHVMLRARSLRRHLGSAVPEKHPLVAQTLDRAVSDFSDDDMREFARALFFWLAGPYRLRDGWYVTSPDLPLRSTEALLKLRNADGIIGDDGVKRALSKLGILADFRSDWVKRLTEFVETPAGLMWSDQQATEVMPTLGA